MSLKGKITLIILLGFAGLAVWFYPLITNLIKPSMSSGNTSNVPSQIEPQSTPEFRYPSLGIQAPMINSPGTDPMRLTDWNKMRQALRQGVDLTYKESTFETAPLAFIVGHSSDVYPNQFSSVFAGLGQAKQGDTFQISLEKYTYAFTVVEKKVINPMDTQAFLNFAPTTSATQRVALVTCWPVLTTKNRLVIIGERQR